MKKLLPPTLLLICLLAMIGLWWLFPICQLFAAPATFIGLLPLAVGLVLATLGEKQFKEAGTNVKPFKDPDVLVKEGLYKYSRNPMYLGFGSILFGTAVLLGSLSTLMIVFAFFMITDRWYIQFEEQAMSQKFGEEYEKYKTQTRRWF